MGTNERADERMAQYSTRRVHSHSTHSAVMPLYQWFIAVYFLNAKVDKDRMNVSSSCPISKGAVMVRVFQALRIPFFDKPPYILWLGGYHVGQGDRVTGSEGIYVRSRM